jgi:hypothetical protein
LHDEWVNFRAEPWGDEWRPTAELISTLVSMHAPKSAKKFEPDHILRSMFIEWKIGVRSAEEISSDQMQATMAQVVQGARHGR